jgi:hypothetical protein
MPISRTTRGLLLAGLLALFGSAAHAQFRASIQGTVTDSTGAAIPNAQVTLKDNANNATQTATSNAEGVYNFGALPPDHFTLTATAPGFKQKVLSNLTIIPEQANSVNVQLDLGETSTTITVSAEAQSAIDTETPNIGGTVNSNDIQHLPSFNRDVFTLTQLAPGAVSDNGQNAGGGVRSNPGTQGPGGSGNGGAPPTENGPQANANGGQYETNGISIDGISTVSAVWGGTTIITPTEDSIDNVRIVTNDYDAENGRFSGAQTLVTSKSGTNQIHGSAFIAIHRPGLNAYNRSPIPAISALRDTQRYNQYGGSLGGPIWKDKIFAFFAYEATPNSSTATTTGWYELPSLRSAAPSGSIASTYLNFAGSAPVGTIQMAGQTCTTVGLQEGVNCNTIAGQGLDIGSPLKGVPLGAQDTTSSGTAQNPGLGGGLDKVADVAFYSTATPFSSSYKQYNGRLDANLGQKDHIAFAIYWVPYNETKYNGGARAYNLFHHNQINEAMSGIWNHTFSPNFLNEARANAAGWRWNEIASNSQQPVGLPQATVTFAPSATLSNFGTAVGSDLNQWTFTYKDVATKVLGPHTVKFGAEFTQLHYLNNPVGRPNYGFYNIWDFLNDAPYQESGSFSSVTGLPGGTRNDDRENLFGAFVQDDWKVRPTVTLHLGVRYSYFGALYAKQNNLPHVVFGSGSSAYTGMSVTTSGSAWNPQKGNFGPQIGFNWAPGKFNNKLVVRGGWGLNFNQEEIAITANTGFNPPTANYNSFSFTSPTNPGTNGADIIYALSSSPTSLAGYPSNKNTITSYNANGLPVKGSANVIILGDGHGNLPTEYTEHWSLDTEYQISRDFVASLGYQGSAGHHLINHQTPNAPGVVAGEALNPLVTSGDFWINGGSSNNNALLVEVKHPMVHHIQADAQFMWAKSLDTDGSGPYYEDPYFPLNPAYSYGPSDFNVGKSFKLFALWQPVIFHGSAGWAEKVLGEWSLSGIWDVHTGFPYSPTYNIPSSLYCTQCGYSNIRPYYKGGAGNDHSNKAFYNGSNFTGLTTSATTQTATVNNSPKPVIVQYSNQYFYTPNYFTSVQSVGGTGFPNPNVALPPLPGLDRNAFVGPGYRDVDASLTKGFGIPNNRVTGENGKLEIRADVFNLFNLLNLSPTGVAANVASSNFGQDTSPLGGRTITLQARFSF